MMQLFSYQIDQNLYPTSLATLLKVHMSQAETSILPRVKGNTLQVYNLQGKLEKSGTLPVTFSEGTMYCLVNEDTLMCIGGDSADMYSLNLSKDEVTRMKAMRAARGYFGILKVGQFIYTFGGLAYEGRYQVSLKSCEKYSLEAKEWAALPQMLYSRSVFNPCLYSGAIYVADGSYVEMFELASEKFTEIPTSLTLGYVKFALFVADRELIALTEDHKLARWSINSTEKDFRVSVVAVTPEWVGTNYTRVQVGRDFYWVSQKTEGVISFNVDSLKLSKT